MYSYAVLVRISDLVQGQTVSPLLSCIEQEGSQNPSFSLLGLCEGLLQSVPCPTIATEEQDAEKGHGRTGVVAFPPSLLVCRAGLTPKSNCVCLRHNLHNSIPVVE